MKKIQFLVKNPCFWTYCIGIALLFFALETFFLGLWEYPVFGLKISYMGKISPFDIIYAGVFALLLGFTIALFATVKKTSSASCALSGVSGFTAMVTMLCPICPILLLSFLGLSTTLTFLAPYFWPLRIVSIILIGVAIVMLWKRLQPKKIEKVHEFLAKIGIAVMVILVLNNQAMAMLMNMKLKSEADKVELSGKFVEDVGNLVTPTEIPFYGDELGLDYSSVAAINRSIGILAEMAPMQGSNPIELTDEEMARYVQIGTEKYVACEFCCSAKTLVRNDGSPTCGCAHSIGMRGTAAYLIRFYPEMTNAQIAYELMRQKGLYFPKQMQKRMAQELAGEPENVTADIRYLTQNLSDKELKKLMETAKTAGFEPPKNDPNMVGGC